MLRTRRFGRTGRRRMRRRSLRRGRMRRRRLRMWRIQVMEYLPLYVFLDTPLNVLKLNFRLGNVDIDRGTIRKY
jgi:hypothetical protein